jgi:hypothetical protein
MTSGHIYSQIKMNDLGRWCSRNFMSINAIKSYVMVFGPLPPIIPKFSFDEMPVAVTHQQTYVGVSFTSTSRNIFDNHYNVKASKARAVGNLIFGMESSVGILPPSEGKVLYMSLLDPHLTHGAEVCLDIDRKSLQVLEDVQHTFIRRLLGLGKSSLLAPLFTETGLMPLKFRRLSLALQYLIYLLALQPQRLAHKALQDSIALNESGSPGWVMDLRYVVRSLALGGLGDIALPDFRSLSVPDVEAFSKKIMGLMTAHMQSLIDNSPKLYLLHGRLEPNGKGGLTQKSLHFRHYLNVANIRYRVCLTRLLLSCHPLALERLRYPEHRRAQVQRSLRLCRFCQEHIESPEHALFECIACQEINDLRSCFYSILERELALWPVIVLLNPI